MPGRGLSLLRWTLAAVLGVQGLALGLRPAGPDAALPEAARVALGVLEAGGAALLLVPRTVVAGALLLALALAAAAAAHARLGIRPPLAYLVYLAALGAVAAARRTPSGGVRDAR